MPEYVGIPNYDGSPHELQNSILYSSMPYEWMRASTVWKWDQDDVRFKALWLPFARPDNETAAELRAWLRERGYCTLFVKTFTPPQCRACRRNYTLRCKQQNHEKEIVA